MPLMQKYLNELLLTEIESLLEFSLQSRLPGDPRIQEKLAAFAHEETEHIRMLMGLVVRAGAEVSLGAPRISHAENLDEFFCKGAAREDDAIKRYTALLELVQDPQDRAMLEQAVAQEQAHRAHLESIRSACEALRLE